MQRIMEFHTMMIVCGKRFEKMLGENNNRDYYILVISLFTAISRVFRKRREEGLFRTFRLDTIRRLPIYCLYAKKDF